MKVPPVLVRPVESCYLVETSLMSSSLAIFYSFATMAGGLTGLIAYGVQNNLNGNSGISAWRWLYITEGVLGVFVGLLVLCLLPPFPDKIGGKHWLFTSDEVEMAVERSSSE